MFKIKIAIGIIGTIVFAVTLVAFAYATNSPLEVSYSSEAYVGKLPIAIPTPNLSTPASTTPAASPLPAPLPALRVLYLPVLVLVLILPIFLIVLWISVWRIKTGKPLRMLPKQIGKWIFAHAYQIALVVTGIYLALVVLVWFESNEFKYQTQASRYGSPISNAQGEYTAIAEMSGPSEFRIGTSNEITFTMSITTGIAPDLCILSPLETYTVNTYIQAVNFEIDESVKSFLSTQKLSINNPAFWSWVITPKEKMLGRQSIVVMAYIEDTSNKIGYTCRPYLSMNLNISDPLGIPSTVFYGLMTFSGVVGLPFWAWLYNEWSMRQKEKRERALSKLPAKSK